MTSEERTDFVYDVLKQRADNPSDDDAAWISIEEATQRIVDRWESELSE